MIFVVLGTWPMPFPRPLIEIEKLIINGYIKEEVIVQAGNTDFKSNYLKIYDFFDKNTFDRHYNDASFLIMQAGVGSIMNGLMLNKKIISLARLAKYNEHIDDHQLDILSVFSVKGYILPWYDSDNLKSIIDKLNTFTPQKYPFSMGKISETIIDFIDKQ